MTQSCGNGEIKSDKKTDMQCGIGPCQPTWLQRLANIRAFVAGFSLVTLGIGLCFAGLISTITTIERRFLLTSKESGFILTAYEITHIPAVFLVGYFCSRSHAPRTIALGSLATAISMLFGILPHIIYGESDEFTVSAQLEQSNSTPESLNSTTRNPLCSLHGQEHIEGCSDNLEIDNSNYGAYSLILCLTIGLGAATSPISLLGLPYVDGNCKKHKSAQYMGVILSMYGLGPLLGFILGANVLQIHVTLKDTLLTIVDPRWVGAYWLLFLICAIVMALPGFILVLFPRHLKKNISSELGIGDGVLQELNEQTKDHETTRSTSNFTNQAITSIKGLPRTVLRLVKMPVLCGVLVNWTIEIFIGTGYFVFMPKYIEEQFGQTSSFANTIVGLVGSGAGGVGMLLSGVMVTKLKMDRTQAAKCNFIFVILTTACLVALALVGCDTGKVESLTGGGRNTTCALNCGCTSIQFNPVCGGDGVSYQSPCHAGCTSSSASGFENCECLLDANTTSSTQGLCPGAVKTCNVPTALYCVFTFCSAFLNGLAAMTTFHIIFRSVSQEDKPFAMALQNTGASLVASIPAPAVFGSLVDSACVLWQTTACSQAKVCRAFDPNMLRYYTHGLGAGLKVITVFASGFIWYRCKREDLEEFEESRKEDNKNNEQPEGERLVIESKETTI